MVTTRSDSISPKKRATIDLTGPETKNMRPPSTQQGQPLKLVVLPKTVSVHARLLTLIDPVDGISQKQFLFCPTAGLHELTTISTPKHEPRSILCSRPENAEEREETDDTRQAVSNGYIIKTAAYTTVTPYDLCFLLLPVVVNNSKGNLLQPLDDLFEEVEAGTKYILAHGRVLVELAMDKICETLDVGDEKMYRYCQKKTLTLLISKAQRVYQTGLPASLEEKFVTRALETPMLSVKREDSSVSLTVRESQEVSIDASQSLKAPEESFDSQSTSAVSTTPSAVFSEASVTSNTTMTTTTTTLLPEKTAVSTDVCQLQRLLTAFKFIAHSYISSSLTESLSSDLDNKSLSPIDFSPLHAHLGHLAELRKEAAASMTMSDFTHKRTFEDDAEAAERAEKKRKLEEDEKKRKASTSRGVKDLAKVNVTGMKKMSDFFSKKPASMKAKT